MSVKLFASLIVFGLFLNCTLSADDLPQGGLIILAPQPTPGNMAGMRFGGKESKVEIVPANNGEFAYRITVNKQGKNRWDVQINTIIPSAIREGDVYFVSFDARCIESMNQEGTVHANVERNGPPHNKAMSRGIAFASQWTRINLPFVVRKGFAFDPNGSVLTLHVAAAAQVIELANIKLIDFGQRVPVDTLPKTRSSYDGIKPDAPWRKEATSRIDQYRKANLTINVQDQQGNPVKGATIHIQQQRHAFPFGTALNIRYFTSGDQLVPTYNKALLERFNAVVFENALKWQRTTGHSDAAAVGKGINFVKENELFMRGHVLVWPSARHVPSDIRKMIEQLKKYPNDQVMRQTLREAVEHRITWMATEMAGKVNDWDVVNETFSNHDIMDVLDPAGTPHGKGVMVDWFKLAHKADPNAKLFLNDYGILTNGNVSTTHQQYFYDTIKDLIDSGAPIHGIGMQAHFGAMLTSPDQLWNVLDRFAKLGLPIKITEFDMDLDDMQLKADYTRDLYTALFAHPHVDGLLSWGFWAGRHWRPDAAYLDKQFKPRPHDIAMRKLLFEDWWTNTTLSSNAKGEASNRIFKGQHQLTITWLDGKTSTENITVTDDKTINIKH